MLSNLSNKLSAAFARPLKSKSTESTVRLPLAEWSNTLAGEGEPLFNRSLTSEDLSALEESAGLGPPSWWLDVELALSDPSMKDIDMLSYEDEVALTALLRAPFEQAGEIRSAAGGLLDRLIELERLEALAVEEGRRRAQGKEKRVRHHSTLRLASKSIDGQEDTEQNIENVDTPSALHRRGTYFVQRRPPPACDPMKRQQEDLMNPRFCKSPERREPNRSDVCELQRTYSKNSLNRLNVENELRPPLNVNIAASDLSENSTQHLGRTYDAEELSDVFPSPRGSVDRLKPSQLPPPPTLSSELPQGATRRSSSVLQTPQSHVRQHVDALIPRPSASPRRSAHPACSSAYADKSQLRDSLPARLNVQLPDHHKLSAPEAMGLKTSGSGSNILPTSMSDAMALMREQELKLRASSGRACEINTSLTNSIDSGGSGGGAVANRLNKSLQGDAGNMSHIFAQREVKDVPSRYDPVGKRAVSGELSRIKSSSQSSLKDMASLKELIRAQAESLRVSGEEAMHKVLSRSSLGRSLEASSKISASPMGSRDSSPHLLPVAEPSLKEPIHHRPIVRPTELRDSGATYDLNATRESTGSSIHSVGIEPPKQSSSPVTMRRPQLKSSSYIPPLTVGVELEADTPETPQTTKTIRPSSYVESLQSAKHASSAVGAWVADTLTTMDTNNRGVDLSASGESFGGLRGSSETYALPEKREERPTGLSRPARFGTPPSKLVKPPSNPLGTKSDNAMTTSQRTVISKIPAATKARNSTTVRRGLAPSAIVGGASRKVGVSSVRPPNTLPPRSSTGTRAPGTSYPSRGGTGGQLSQLRPPTKVKLPSVPRGRTTYGSGSLSKGAAHNPAPPEY